MPLESSKPLYILQATHLILVISFGKFDELSKSSRALSRSIITVFSIGIKPSALFLQSRKFKKKSRLSFHCRDSVQTQFQSVKLVRILNMKYYRVNKYISVIATP